MWAVKGVDALPAIDISTWVISSSIESLPDIWSLTLQQVTMNSDAGFIFKALRDSVVIQDGKKLIKNWLFYFMDILKEDFIWKPEYFSLRIWEKTFLFRTITNKDIIVYISKDISTIELLIFNLIKLSIGATITFIIAIYFLSRFFAQLAMSPIRENNVLLKDFNHSLAHEIKTPLSVIRLNLETLESKRRSSLISSAIEEVDTISSITDAMLFISEWIILRESEDIDLVAYIGGFIEKYYEWMIDIIGESKKYVKVTPILLDRILINLCQNALKYGDSIPVITIKEDWFSVENISNKVISPESLQKLGTPFFQAHIENKKTWNWLGLSIVKKIIEILWWKISFTYENAIFTVHISITHQ